MLTTPTGVMETLNQRKHWIEPESLNKAKYKGVSTSSPLQVQEMLMTSNNQKVSTHYCRYNCRTPTRWTLLEYPSCYLQFIMGT